jgi:predicted flap endonuclease-1-like 5' DNA nuclease
MQQRLNHIGIYTYEQLACANPESLRGLLGEIGRRMKCEDWISQALELVSRYDIVD